MGIDRISLDERIRNVDSSVKEAIDFFWMLTPSYFSGVSHLLGQKYPEWLLEKIEEKNEAYSKYNILSLLFYVGEEAKKYNDEKAYDVLQKTLLEPFYLLNEKEREEKEV